MLVVAVTAAAAVLQVKRLLLAPNPFAGITKAGGSSHISSNSSRPQQQQQQLPGSPLVSRPLAFSPATPAKQPVVPSVVRYGRM